MEHCSHLLISKSSHQSGTLSTSPQVRVSQANRATEHAVHTAKYILKQDDAYVALLSYHATAIPELGASPAELAYGRKLRTTLPVLPQTLSPQTLNRKEFKERNRVFKQPQKTNFDHRNGVQPLPSLSPGDPVVM